MNRSFVDVADRSGAVSSIADRVAQATDVYVGVLPRGRHRGGLSDLVPEARVLWADCDTRESAGALRTFAAPPSIVMRSGTPGHYHAYWLLAEPVGLDDVERLNRRIAHALGADAASTDRARILRPPSLNHKHIPPASVIIDWCDGHRRHALGDILRVLPVCSDTSVVRRYEHRRRASTTDPLLTVSARIYVEQLTGIRVPRHGKIRCPFHEDRVPSLHVYVTPERGWYCYGCRRGGSVYDFAALLFHRTTRGTEFMQVRDYLRCRLL